MGASKGKKKGKGKKVRVAFRQNRSKPARSKDWTEHANPEDEHKDDTALSEGVRAKGALSRRRTIIVHDDEDAWRDLTRGVVVAMRGLFADVDDGQEVWPCTVRRILRTRLIGERQPVTVGDHVGFRPGQTADDSVREGVIERVEPRTGQLRRKAGRRIHTIVANVDQALIVSSAGEPSPKPNLIDRYIVAACAGDITPIVCMNKIDLDLDGAAAALLARYAGLGYATVATSAEKHTGIEALRETFEHKATVIVGQSGVGKSSLLNAAQPGLKLRTGVVAANTQKGRHTTTTAELIRLGGGGYVVDTPGIRSFDLTVIPRHQFEAYFAEFVDCVADCRFPDCTHTHEIGCALKLAVEEGRVHPDRYRSYVQMFEDPGVIE